MSDTSLSDACLNGRVLQMQIWLVNDTVCGGRVVCRRGIGATVRVSYGARDLPTLPAINFFMLHSVASDLVLTTTTTPTTPV